MKTPRFIVVLTDANGNCFGPPYDGFPSREVIGMYYAEYHNSDSCAYGRWYDKAESDGCRATLYELVSA